MTAEDNKTVLRRLAHAFNKRNRQAFEELFSPHFVLHDPNQPEWPHGLEGVRQMWTAMLTAVPDLQVTIEDLFSEGDKVAVRWTFQGKWAGEVEGQPSTYELSTAVSIAIYRIVNGKIAEDWGLALARPQTNISWE
jgi:steroid delta-isomerase-like uncharacterized protein